MEPTHVDNEYPNRNCPIHEKALEEIKGIVLETRAEVRKLKEIGGPIVSHEKRIEAIEVSDRRAHKRISEVEKGVTEVKHDQNKIILKVGAVLAPLAAAVGGGVGAVIAHIAK